MAKYKLDLFSVLRMLDRRDLNVHKSLEDDPEALKELERAAGWMLPMWMTASRNERDHKRLLSEFEEKANGVWLSTAGHPILQLKLLAACGTGRGVNHKFYGKSATKYGDLVFNFLQDVVPDITVESMEKWVKRNTEEEAEELARQCGRQPKEVKDILVEFRRIKQ